MPKVTSIVSRVTNRISLVQGHDYELIGIEDSSFRIVDESGEPALHPKSCFLECENIPPHDWKYHDFGDGVYSYYPPEFASIGFFEDHADGEQTAVQSFTRYLESRNLPDRR